MVALEFDKVPPIAKYLSGIFLISRLGMTTVWFFLPIFFKQNIDSVFLIGVMTSLPAIIPVIFDIPVGNLVQRAGEKIVIFLGLLTALFPPLLYLTGIPLLLVLAKGLEGVMKTFVWNGGWSLTLQSADEEHESETTSVFLMGVNLTSIIGPVIGGYLIAAKGFPITFALWVLSAWLGVLVFYLYIGLEGDRGFVDSVEDLFHRETYIKDYRDLKTNWSHIKFPLTLIALHAVIFSFFWLAVPLLLDQVGGGFETMGIIFGLAATPRIFQFMFGEISDKIGCLKVSAILALFLIPSMAAMGIFSNLYVLGALFLFARLFTSGMTPALHAFWDARVPDDVESELTGFMEMSKHAGQAVGPVLAGTAASIWSINASFFAAAIIAVIIFILSAYGASLKLADFKELEEAALA